VDDDAIAPVCALFGLDGFRLLGAADAGGEVELLLETAAELVGCPECGAVARAKDRRPTWVRDLPVAGRPVVLCWWKRIWCCPYSLCEKRTWTERHPAIAPRAVLTERARQWACAEVAGHDATVAEIATRLGVAWATVWTQVKHRGRPLIDDRARLDPPGAPVTAVGVDETAFLRATGQHPTQYTTGIADLTPGRPARLLDVVEGRSGPVLADWLRDRERSWRQRVRTASLDPFRGISRCETGLDVPG
jgi:transposase